MIRLLGLFTQVYSALLHLYPSQFRHEFADEMQLVFAQALKQAMTQGNVVAIMFCLCELRDLPRAILYEHWQEMRNMEDRTGDTPKFENVSWSALLAAAVPFLAIASLSLINLFQLGGANPPDWLALVFLAIIALPFLIGLFKGVPQWCLPYFGFFGSMASLCLLLIFQTIWRRLLTNADPWIIQQIVSTGGPWISFSFLEICFVVIALGLPSLHQVYARIRQDWTLVSFALYGSMAMALILTFEDYTPSKWLFIILCAIILAIGEWAYLRNTRVRQRALVLFVSITLTMAIATIGKAYLATIPNWPFPGTPDWQAEAIGTVSDAAWVLVVILGLPALVNLLPRPSHSPLPT